jgi:outer membrane protein assembly factor BamB|tara:strand:- start:463 stop:2124 length:1662 start_codon:yes stop_codon:yes gene_type:complete
MRLRAQFETLEVSELIWFLRADEGLRVRDLIVASDMNEFAQIGSDMKPRPRWKLLVWIEGILVLLWGGLKMVPGIEEKGAGGAVDLLLVLLVFLVALIWLLLLSGLRWKVRLIGAAVMLALLGLVKMDGHTGSFFPQFSWRWTKESAKAMPEVTGTVAKEGTLISTEGAEHFARFLGAEMKNWVSGALLPEGWSNSKPKELWRKQIGEGWSAFSVAGDFAYTLEQRGEQETTICYELRTGDVVWVHGEDVRFEESMGDDGPRSTPTVVDGKVFSYGATGILNCLDARTGEMIWGKDVLVELGQQVPTWAKSCSPLVVDGKVIVTLGKEAEKNLAAFNISNGELLWRAGDYSSSYASPVVATLAGKRQIVAIQQKSVDGYEIESGEILWSFPIGNPQGNCASPLILEDTVITSSGYGYGTHRIKITPMAEGEGFGAEEMWHSRKLKSKFANMVVKDGGVYGLNEGRLVCLNLEDGSLRWRGSNFGHGQLLGVGDHMIVQTENGGISIVEISPEEEKVVGEFDALEHRTWNNPVLAGRILLVRNDREAIAFEFLR